jgi:hypothetical protein
MSDTLCPSDPATIRAEIARSGRRVYEIAAVVGRHPARLSTMLHADAPFPEDLGRRILMALKTNERFVRS